MHETPAELDALQQLLDDSFARSSEHLRSIMEPHRRLPAGRLVDDLPSPAVLNIATVTAGGEPRVSAVDGHFLHGRWHFSTAPESPKVRHLSARPAISASYTPRDGYGVFCHGRAQALAGEEYQQMIQHMAGVYGVEPTDWDGVACFRIEPHWMTAFEITAEELAEFEAAKTDGDGVG